MVVVPKLQFESQLQFYNCARDMLDGLLPMQAALNFSEEESSLHPDIFPILCQLSKYAFYCFLLWCWFFFFFFLFYIDNGLRFCPNRVMDMKILLTRGTTSPARTVVCDIGEEILALTLFSPRGPGLGLAYSGTACGQASMEAGNLAILPKDIDPDLLCQYPHLRVRTPTRTIHRFVYLL